MSIQFVVQAVRVFNNEADLVELREVETPETRSRGNFLTIEAPAGTYQLRDTVTVTVSEDQ